MNNKVEIRRTAKDTLDELKNLVNACESIEKYDEELAKLVILIQNAFYNAKPIKNESKKIVEYHVIIPEKEWNKIVDLNIYARISLQDEI
jgi:hypothetical protein